MIYIASQVFFKFFYLFVYTFYISIHSRATYYKEDIDFSNEEAMLNASSHKIGCYEYKEQIGKILFIFYSYLL